MELGFQILGICPDKPENLKPTIDKGKLKYQLLSDASMAGARGLGIAFRVDDGTYAKLGKYGIDLEKASGHRPRQLPVPSVFIIDSAGVVQFSYVNPKYSVRLAPEVLLAAAKSVAKRE